MRLVVLDVKSHGRSPAILLGRLAVDRQAQGHGLGAGLLRHAMELTVAASETIGVRMLVVTALRPERRSSTSDSVSHVLRRTRWI